MLSNPDTKYRPFDSGIDLPERTWPSKRINSAPRWCSVDLRDGNQALVNPMTIEKKLRLFDLLVKTGFKEIEVGFPSASKTDFDFIRHLIDTVLIPEDVSIQVLTQSRDDLISRTFDALDGVGRAIVHFYNATAPVFRRTVFGMDKSAIIQLAVSGAKRIADESARRPATQWTFEYSPEAFSSTEPEFALEICEAVLEVWRPRPDHPVIFNLPATVESATPNIYADQIEWFCRNISRRDCVTISAHPHNDRGTAVAASEFAVMAGADRVEGCLFGHGERTGNVDLVTQALNLYSQGVAPGLDFSNIDEVVNMVECCTQIPVHPRHPYAGDFVFTAFSGSHQDAIKKGFEAREKRNDSIWNIPYLTVDPADLGRSYEAVIRVNSQSGKGGVAWVLWRDKGLKLPRHLQQDFSHKVQAITDATGRELTVRDVWDAFTKTYCLDAPQRFSLIDYTESGADTPDRARAFKGRIRAGNEEHIISGAGTGLVSAALDALKNDCGVALAVVDYQEHALGKGTDAPAAAYIECRTGDGSTVFGVGIDADIATASLKAVLNAANVAFRDRSRDKPNYGPKTGKG
ncbi:MAG: 2-isopropylmalate synthase [Hyphomicrobiales bacterium]